MRAEGGREDEGEEVIVGGGNNGGPVGGRRRKVGMGALLAFKPSMSSVFPGQSLLVAKDMLR